MPKIYTLPRNLILAIMAELFAKHGFSAKETYWKPTTVLEELVVFELHQRVKNLMEKEICELESEPGNITFEEQGDSIWNATVQANGAESYYFARILFLALARLQSGVVDVRNSNLEIIERYTRVAAMKVIGSTISFVAKAKYEQGKYSISVPVNGMTLTFTNENVDLLCRWIGQQLRGCLVSKKPRKKR